MTKSDSFRSVYIGVVVANADFQNMGRLEVNVPELGTIGSSIKVSYASPFIGASDPEAVDPENTETFEGTQTSYGWWGVPPSLNAQVLIAFVNGEPSRGYWFACIPQTFMNHMLPNIPVGDSYQYDGERVPVAEVNRASTVPNKQKGKRPFHKVHYEAIRNQGLKNDAKRGFSQNGATSSPTSSVMGLLSPKGHYFSVEDTTDDEKIRIRTKSGVQLLLDESDGMIYMINKSGSGWVEIDNTGKIMIYGESGIAMRTKGDFSVRADRDVILESGRNTVVHSNGDIKMQTNNIINNAKGSFVLNATSDVSIITAAVNLDSSGGINAKAGGVIALTAGGNLELLGSGDTNISGTNVNIGANANLVASGNAQASFSGNAQVTLASGGVAAIGGAVTNFNMGAAFVGAAPAVSAAPEVVVPDEFVLFDKVDVTQPTSDDEPTVESLPTIVTTLPTHEPCQEHGATPEDLG